MFLLRFSSFWSVSLVFYATVYVLNLRRDIWREPIKFSDERCGEKFREIFMQARKNSWNQSGRQYIGDIRILYMIFEHKYMELEVEVKFRE